MRYAALVSVFISVLQAAQLTADMVDFSGAYSDFATFFGTIASLSVLLLSARAVFNFLGR